MKAWHEGVTFPGLARQDDQSLSEYARASIIPYFHLAGTCRMGSGRDAVVDAGTPRSRHPRTPGSRRIGDALHRVSQLQRHRAGHR